jgi:quercetin dioxygenase-like cupin family protein
MGRMEWITLPSRPLEAFGSQGVRVDQATAVIGGDDFSVHIAHFEEGGIIGRHPARIWQLFAVLSGSGWVSGDDLGSWPISAGQAVLWEPGEVHQSTASEPMVVLIIRSRTRPPVDAIMENRQIQR